jgi:O-antigen/teichoic acid export membrane protein
MGSLFLMNIVLARDLPKADYSAFLAAASLMPFLAMLATAGVPFTLIRALRGGSSASNHKAAIFRGALILTLVASAITAAGIYISAAGFPDEPKWHVLRHLPGLMGAWFVLSAICIVCASFLQGVDDFRTAALIGARNGGLVPNCLSTAAVSGAAWFGLLTLRTLMSIQIVGFVAALALAGLVIPSLIASPTSKEAAPEKSGLVGDAATYGIRWYFVESWPNLINQMIAVALVEMDLFWVTCLAQESVVADYGVIRNLRLLVTAPLLIASVSLAPFVAELYGKGDLRRLERLLRGTATLLAAPSLVALTVLLLMPAPIIRWTFGPDFVEAATALQIASIGCVIFVISGSNGLTLTMTGRHRDLMVCSLASLGLYLAISPFLVARYGLVGAATAFSIQTAAQNIVLSLRVKQTTGLWTIPWASPLSIRTELDQLLRCLKFEKKST